MTNTRHRKRPGRAALLALLAAAGGCPLDLETDESTLERPACHDTISGGPTADSLRGDRQGDTQDCITGMEGDDQLVGGDADDVLTGGRGRDVLDGGDGFDWLVVDPEDARADGGGGIDTLTFDRNYPGVTDRVDLAAYAGRVERIEALRHSGKLALRPDDVAPMLVTTDRRLLVDAGREGPLVLEGSGWTATGESLHEYGADYDLFEGVAAGNQYVELAVSRTDTDTASLIP